MSQNMKQSVLKKFQQIPGVGKKISLDLWGMSLRSVEDLKENDPEKLYRELCESQCVQVDRCMLYVFCCAVYYASNKRHDPELLKWWNWKDDKLEKKDENPFT
ncbi:MAG: pathogenicity locus [Candidatus Methanoperedens sp.]|nr:pathogenicity locus [Candidatus Methanoperedens sp.]